jgi:hypothetical protein
VLGVRSDTVSQSDSAAEGGERTKKKTKGGGRGAKTSLRQQRKAATAPGTWEQHRNRVGAVRECARANEMAMKKKNTKKKKKRTKKRR